MSDENTLTCKWILMVQLANSMLHGSSEDRSLRPPQPIVLKPTLFQTTQAYSSQSSGIR